MSKYKTDEEAFDGHAADADRWFAICWLILFVFGGAAVILAFATHARWTILLMVPTLVPLIGMGYHVIRMDRAYRRLYPKHPRVPLSPR